MAAIAGVLVLFAGCSSSRPRTGMATASTSGGEEVVTIKTGPDLRFHPSTIVVHPGRVRLTLANNAPNESGPQHDIQFDDFAAGFVPLVQAGLQRSVTFTAPTPGRYHFVCTIHENQGQSGVMVVEKGQ